MSALIETTYPTKPITMSAKGTTWRKEDKINSYHAPVPDKLPDWVYSFINTLSAEINSLTEQNIKLKKRTMDFSKFANDKIELSHFTWLGFKNGNGALVMDNFDGEIQFYDGNFWYCKDNVSVKKIEINKDIDDIFLKQYYLKNQTNNTKPNNQ